MVRKVVAPNAERNNQLINNLQSRATFFLPRRANESLVAKKANEEKLIMLRK